MRTLLLLFVLPAALHVRAQIRDFSECSEVTQRFVEHYYDFEKQLDVKENPETLSRLEYICARSYEYADGFVLESQKALFVVQRYEHLRAESYRVKIFDEYSGLTIILYSWSEVNAEKQKIAARYQLTENAAPEVKKRRQSR